MDTRELLVAPGAAQKIAEKCGLALGGLLDRNKNENHSGDEEASLVFFSSKRCERTMPRTHY